MLHRSRILLLLEVLSRNYRILEDCKLKAFRVNYLITPMIVISFVSLPKFLENLVYYIYMYGFILWSIYRIILAGIALSCFRMGKGSIRGILGPVRDKPWLTILLIVTLPGISILIL